jgi:hypothetical protein
MPTQVITMPDVTIELSDAVELAELLTFLADWFTSNQRQTLADILSAHVGHDALGSDELAADLHRFVFLLGLRRTHTMINTDHAQHPALDRITRITTAIARHAGRSG